MYLPKNRTLLLASWGPPLWLEDEIIDSRNLITISFRKEDDYLILSHITAYINGSLLLYIVFKEV